MKYLHLIILMSGLYKSHGQNLCGLGHSFQPVSSEGSPCSPQNLDCIRIFFANTWNCLQRKDLLPLFANVTEFTFFAPSSNISATAYGIDVGGIKTGRGIQLYLRPRNMLVVAAEWPRIDVRMRKVVVRLPDMEVVVVTEFRIRFDYILMLGRFLSSEITISRNVQTFVEQVYPPVFQHGPEHSTESLNILFSVLLRDVNLMIQNFFVVRGAEFMDFLVNSNLCRPNGFLDSDTSICSPLNRRTRNILGQNSTIPSY